MKRLAARAKNSQALRRVLMPLLVHFPSLPRRLMTLAQRFAKDVHHPDWPRPLPAAYLRLPLPTRKVLLDLARAALQSAPAALADPARLAWVAPHAPDAVTSTLLRELAQRYTIDLVILAPDAEADNASDFPRRDVAWFAKHHHRFDCVLYQIANTVAHRPVLALLARYQGIVILRDFSLGNAVAVLPQTLFHAHGYSGLLAWRSLGDAATLAAFPLNRVVFDAADGVIVDEADAKAIFIQTQRWYGPRGAAVLHPARASAGPYAATIEAILTNSPAARYRRAVRGLAACGIPATPHDRTLIATAQALAASDPAWAPRQLLVDISFLVRDDLKTGIQRVVRSILLALFKDPPAGFRVEPVYGDAVQPGYRYARRFTLALLGFDSVEGEDDPIAYQTGDIFLGLDLAKNSTLNNLDTIDAMRDQGVAIHFVMYDILPLLQPHAFPYGAAQHFQQHVLAIAQHADGVACISRAVADELASWLDVHDKPRRMPLKIAYFHLGADLDASAPSSGMPTGAGQVLAAMAARPSILMVGTLEPRKGHAQALAAFELLWQDDIDVNLVIVGKQGWMVDALADTLRTHAQRGHKLFWLPGVSDQMLTETYRLSSALLAASVGEGFGLPLIEAAQHGLPIIARSLPVFREVSGVHAFYFDGLEPESLAAALRQWLALDRQGQAPPSAAMPWLHWSDSASQLLEAVVHGRWYKTLTPRVSTGERL